MVIPNTMKRRQSNNRTSGKKFKPNGKQDGFPPNGWFSPHSMMERPYRPGQYPPMHPGHYPRMPPPPPHMMFRGRMGPPAPPPYPPMGGVRRPMRPPLRPPMMRPGPMRPPFMPPGPRGFGPPLVQQQFRKANFRKTPRGHKKRGGVKAGTKTAASTNATPANPDLVFLNDMSKPWITEGIRAENLKKQQMNKTARETRSDEAWALFKTQRDKCHSLVREARLKYLAKYPEMSQMAPFQINPNTADSKKMDFTEDTLL